MYEDIQNFNGNDIKEQMNSYDQEKLFLRKHWIFSFKFLSYNLKRISKI
jgi:hypothetical protein